MEAAPIGTGQVPARRQRVGEGVTLNVLDLGAHRDFVRGFQASGELRRPQASGEAAEAISWAVEIDGDFRGWVRFRHHRPGPGEVAAYSVALFAVDRPFGGLVWMWECPAGMGLAKALHLPPGAERFASRRAHALAYTSQSQSRPARAAARALTIRAALGGAADLGLPLPPKPKRMRAATYARHVREVQALTAEARGRGGRVGPVGAGGPSYAFDAVS